MSLKGIAGNSGDSVRSDCQVTYCPADSGGIKIELKSKVEPLFGDSIRETCCNVLETLEINHCSLSVVDSGALDCVIAARVEAAVKLIEPSDKSYLPELIPQNRLETTKERFRRSRLYLPGNTPKLMLNAGIHKPDGIILDLEDSVAPAKKYEARFHVRNILRSIDFYGCERMVRINQVPDGLEDLDYIVPHYVNLILIPKVETAEQILAVVKRIESIRKATGASQPIWLMPIIESALGVENAFAIASAHKSISSLAIGLEDLTADLGTQRTQEGTETFYARSRVVNAARAVGVQPIDSVYSDVGNMEGLRENVLRSKAMGFDGMGCIHPRQIRVIHEAFAPADTEIAKAKKIVLAFEEAEANGLGVVSLGSKMIDPPVVKRALRTVKLAQQTGILAQDWRVK
ncbi:MAG: citrate lyase subunit gamma [Candidatus Cloacimonetes bacterium]|nr:citrate lyase subunit gamma [Candidatus Cloacimonadota bacterium]